MHTTSRYIGNEQQLQNDLENGNRAGDGDEEVLIVLENVERTSDDTENIVDEQTECRDSQENVVEVALLLAAEFQALNSEKLSKSQNFHSV